MFLTYQTLLCYRQLIKSGYQMFYTQGKQSFTNESLSFQNLMYCGS